MPLIRVFPRKTKARPEVVYWLVAVPVWIALALTGGWVMGTLLVTGAYLAWIYPSTTGAVSRGARMREYILHITGSIRVVFDHDDTIPVTAAELQAFFEDCAVNAYDLDTLHLRLEPVALNEDPTGDPETGC